MIPVSLYGVSIESVERFYEELPDLVSGMHDDNHYTDLLFKIPDEFHIQHISMIDQWCENAPFAWPEDVVQEVTMALRTVAYPDVGLLEHLLTLDGVDCVRLSNWMHFLKNVYPIYSKKACETLDRLNLPTPFKPRITNGFSGLSSMSFWDSCSPVSWAWLSEGSLSGMVTLNLWFVIF